MAGLNDEEWAAARALMRAFAHDLNNLISPLFLYGEMLQESLADPSVKQRAEAILQRSQAMKTLVDASRWIYRGEEDAEQHLPETFFRRFAAVTKSFFQQSGLEAYWVVAKDVERIPPRMIDQRFLLAEKVRGLAAGAARDAKAAIVFQDAEPAAPMRAFIGEEAAAAAARFMLSPSAATVLPKDSISALLASLSSCRAIEINY